MEIKMILKNARKSRELTLQQVSKDTKIAISTINSWERGSSYPRGKNRDVIAAYYKLPPESLDYAKYNATTGEREIDMIQVRPMPDYETKQIMLHKSHWETAENVRKQAGDVDFNELFTRLIKAAAKE